MRLQRIDATMWGADHYYSCAEHGEAWIVLSSSYRGTLCAPMVVLPFLKKEEYVVRPGTPAWQIYARLGVYGLTRFPPRLWGKVAEFVDKLPEDAVPLLWAAEDPGIHPEFFSMAKEFGVHSIRDYAVE